MTSASLPSKKRILTVCVRLFLEQGYKKTTVSEIVHKAEVSNSSFQNIFRAKDGVLTELVAFMFENQFSMARSTAGRQLPPVCVYAVETAKELFGIFGPYQPELTLEKKLRLFLMMNLRAYHVPEAEIAQAVACGRSRRHQDRLYEKSGQNPCRKRSARRKTARLRDDLRPRRLARPAGAV